MGSSIPEFVTRQLASSVVGTTGIDNSRSKMFGAISSGAANVFNKATAFAAEKQRITQFVEADKLQKEYELKAEQEIGVVQKAFANRPADSIEAIDKLGSEGLQKSLEGIKSPRLQAMMSQRISATNRTLRKGMKKWASDQAVRNAGVDFTSFDNLEAGALRNDPSLDSWKLSIGEQETRRGLANSIFSPAQATKVMNDGKSSRTKGFLNGLLAESPAEGAALLNTGQFDQYLTPDERKRYEKDFKGAVEGMQEQQEYDEQIQTLAGLRGAEDLLRKGELTVDYVDGAFNKLEEANLLTPEKEAALNDLREIAVKNVDLTSIDVQETVLGLYEDLRALGVDSDKKTATATVKELVQYTAKVNRAFKDGKILANTRIKLLDNVTTPTRQKAEEGAVDTVGFFEGAFTRRERGEAKTPFAVGFIRVDDWVNGSNFSQGVKDKAKTDMLQNITAAIQEATENGIVVTKELVNTFFEIEKSNEMARQSNLLSNIPPEGKEIRLSNGLAVLVSQKGVVTPLSLKGKR